MTPPIPTLPQTIGLLVMSRGAESAVLPSTSRRMMLRYRWIAPNGAGGHAITEAGSRALATSPHMERAQRELDRRTPTAHRIDGLVPCITTPAQKRENQRQARIRAAAMRGGGR